MTADSELRQRRVGTVVSNRSDKTIAVQVEAVRRHPLYRKPVRIRRKVLAHDAENTCEVGDVVEIVTSRNSRGPSRDWLNPALGYLKTNHARTKVRQWFRKQQRTENLARGREELEKELRRLHLKLSDVEAALLEITGQRSLDDVLIAIGTGENTAHGLALRLAVPTGARPTVKPVPLQRRPKQSCQATAIFSNWAPTMPSPSCPPKS